MSSEENKQLILKKIEELREAIKTLNSSFAKLKDSVEHATKDYHYPIVGSLYPEDYDAYQNHHVEIAFTEKKTHSEKIDGKDVKIIDDMQIDHVAIVSDKQHHSICDSKKGLVWNDVEVSADLKPLTDEELKDYNTMTARDPKKLGTHPKLVILDDISQDDQKIFDDRIKQFSYQSDYKSEHIEKKYCIACEFGPDYKCRDCNWQTGLRKFKAKILSDLVKEQLDKNMIHYPQIEDPKDTAEETERIIDDLFYQDCKPLTDEQLQEIIKADSFQMPIGEWKPSEIKKAIDAFKEAHKEEIKTEEIKTEEISWQQKLDALTVEDLFQVFHKKNFDTFAKCSIPDSKVLDFTLNTNLYKGIAEYIDLRKKQWQLFLEEYHDKKGFSIYWKDLEGKEFSFDIIRWKDNCPVIDKAPENLKLTSSRVELQEISPNAGLFTFLDTFYIAQNEYCALESTDVKPGKIFVNGKHTRIKCLPRKSIICPHCNIRINQILNFKFGIVCPHCKEQVH